MMAEAPSSSTLSWLGSVRGRRRRTLPQPAPRGRRRRPRKARWERFVEHQVAAREFLEQRRGDALFGEPGLELAPGPGLNLMAGFSGASVLSKSNIHNFGITMSDLCGFLPFNIWYCWLTAARPLISRVTARRNSGGAFQSSSGGRT